MKQIGWMIATSTKSCEVASLQRSGRARCCRRILWANHGHDLDRLEHAILFAQDKLKWIEKRNAKAKRPHSLSKLTAGPFDEERGRVI